MPLSYFLVSSVVGKANLFSSASISSSKGFSRKDLDLGVIDKLVEFSIYSFDTEQHYQSA
jgi:hypothetical protein